MDKSFSNYSFWGIENCVSQEMHVVKFAPNSFKKVQEERSKWFSSSIGKFYFFLLLKPSKSGMSWNFVTLIPEYSYLLKMSQWECNSFLFISFGFFLLIILCPFHLSCA